MQLNLPGEAPHVPVLFVWPKKAVQMQEQPNFTEAAEGGPEFLETNIPALRK